MHLTVSNKLLVLSLLGVASGAVVAATGYVSTSGIRATMDRASVTNEALRNHLEADMMHDALKGDVLASLRAQSPEQKDEVRAAVAEHVEWMKRCIESNKRLALGDASHAAIDGIGAALSNYLDSAEGITSLALEDPSAAESSLPEFEKAFGELEEGMEKVSDTVQEEAKSIEGLAAAQMKSAALRLGASLVVSSVAILALGFLLARTIVGPLRKCVWALERLAQSDLTARVGIERSDELGALAAAADGASQSMQRMVGEIREASGQVAAASTQIAASSEEMSGTISGQATEIEGIVESINDLTEISQAVSRDSGVASQSASESGSLAESGGQVMQRMIDGMRGINEAVRAGADSVSRLGARSDEIGRIITVINDIADQTNLLALNAAIEAARAGEHGRGFAVVADEVRKLADRTTKATDEIASSIKAIQSDTKEAVTRIDDGMQKVESGVAAATEAGSSLGRIVLGSRSVGEMVKAIADSAGKQLASSQTIIDRVGSIRVATTQSSEGAQQAAQAAELLSTKAEELRELVSRFQI